MMITADKLSNTEYHAKKDHTSSSDVKMVHSKSLAHWKAKTYGSSPVFDMGTAVHAMVLEEARGVIRGPENRRGKAWTEAYEEAQANDQTLLTAADYDLARNIADSVLFHPVGQRMAGPTTVNEASFFATDPETGLKIKCRPDSYWDAKGVLYDLKTCQDASPRGVAKDMGPSGFNYAIQQAFYMHCIEQAGYEASQFVFVHVEKSGGYAVSTNIIHEEYLDWAKGEMHMTLRKIAKANEAQKWDTGWSDHTNVIDLPRWLRLDAAEL
tara:strand:+ start:708 stop:1511 length:804 start_codon:yes stop_codon:yes gene_type:complete